MPDIEPYSNEGAESHLNKKARFNRTEKRNVGNIKRNIYSQSRTGKFATGFQRVLGVVAGRQPLVPALTAASYPRRQQSKTITVNYRGKKIAVPVSETGIPNAAVGRRVSYGSTGRRGRPAGTFDARYAAYGGVYGYRKALAQKYRLERLQAAKTSNLSPQEKAILAGIQARQQAQMQSIESQTIPDTRGDVPLKSIFDEIDDATHIFD